jgi:hypothetical protein
MMAKRLLWVLVGCLAVTVALPVPALADELDDRLDRSSQAEFNGDQMITCLMPGGELTEVLSVVQADGRLEVRGSSVTVVVDGREVSSHATGGATTAVAVPTANPSQRAGRYHVVVSGRDLELGRTVEIIEVREGDLLRMVYAFDLATGAVLRVESRNDDGTTYCETRYLSFSAGAPYIPQAGAGNVEMDEAVPASEVDSEVLPDDLAGFRRTDAYRGPEQSLVGYYSDGVFSFCLLASERPLEVAELADRPTAEVGGAEYQRAFEPGRVVLVWKSPVGGYALVGDLPLDLQAEVLMGLPLPASGGMLESWWDNLFGR